MAHRGPTRPGEPKGNPRRHQRRPKTTQKRAPNAGKQSTREKTEFLQIFLGPKYVEKQSATMSATQHSRKQKSYFPQKNARRIRAPPRTPIENRSFLSLVFPRKVPHFSEKGSNTLEPHFSDKSAPTELQIAENKAAERAPIPSTHFGLETLRFSDFLHIFPDKTPSAKYYAG